MRGVLAPIPYLIAALTLAGCIAPEAVLSLGGVNAAR